MTIPVSETPEPAIQEEYLRLADGGLTVRRFPEGEVSPPLLEGAAFLTVEEYNVALTAWEAAREEHVAALEAADETAISKDVAALVAIGIPLETARRLAGLAPTSETPGESLTLS